MEILFFSSFRVVVEALIMTLLPTKANSGSKYKAAAARRKSTLLDWIMDNLQHNLNKA